MSTPQRLLRSALALSAVALGAACSEQLEGGAACPSLCPERDLEIVTVELSPVELDTTLARLRPFGEELALLVASRGDTARTYAVIRFDSLRARARRESDTTTFAITKLDSAYLRLRLDTTGIVVKAPFTLDVYDVDTTGVADTSTAPLVGLFREDRRVGSITLDSALLRDTTTHALKDSLRVPLDTAYVRARVAAGGRVRLGFALRSTAAVQLRIFSAESALFPTLNYLATSPDTAKIQTIREVPLSKTPESDASLNGRFMDYTIIVTPTPAGAPQDLAIGGLPGKRSYLRFVLPAEIVDSATITRAELLLTQRPNPSSPSPNDTIGIRPSLVIAGAAVTDPSRAAVIVASGILSDSIAVAPADSGERSLDVTAALRTWRGVKPEDVPRALVLRTLLEGLSGSEVRFFSREAADPSLRPRLRISYVPRVGFGLP